MAKKSVHCMCHVTLITDKMPISFVALIKLHHRPVIGDSIKFLFTDQLPEDARLPLVVNSVTHQENENLLAVTFKKLRVPKWRKKLLKSHMLESGWAAEETDNDQETKPEN